MTKTEKYYNQEVLPKIQEKLGLKNRLAVPKVEKVVLNVGIGKNRDDKKYTESATDSLKLITGQKPKITIAKKAISGFKVREGDNVGLVVTLRKQRMYDFIYKLANIVLPRVRDFRGLRLKGFDKNGNYTLGMTEQIVFPEITHERAEIIHGLSLTIKTTAKNPEEGKAVLEALGFPFEKVN